MTVVITLGIVLVTGAAAHESSSSYDSLVASQCKARCLSLYPWRAPSVAAGAAAGGGGNERRHRSLTAGVPVVYLPSKTSSSVSKPPTLILVLFFLFNF